MMEDEYDDMMMFSLNDIDSHNNNQHIDHGSNSSPTTTDSDTRDSENEAERKFKPLMSLRQRRRSKLTLGFSGLARLNLNNLQNNQKSNGLIENQHYTNSTTLSNGTVLSSSPKVKLSWMKALRKIKSIGDPWEEFHIENYPVEVAVRHKYNPLKKQWYKDKVKVKMEPKAFNHGAMRECFRLKKTSRYDRDEDWKHCQNYVAKSYMENVDREVYFEDVRLQMDAKLWGEEYNRHNPPKKVDIFQMVVLEFTEREKSPLYHLEKFMEGDYIKFNSNSGFVDENVRYTPQAFSHFTFERSGHQLIVVDIQGVGDLWTDPQIHTATGEGYGDGNLGTRGMALFFNSHICNAICESLSLSKFDLAPSELDQQQRILHQQMSHIRRPTMATVARGHEEMVISASPSEKSDLTGFLERCRNRTVSSTSRTSIDSTSDPDTPNSPFGDGQNGHNGSSMDIDSDSITPPNSPTSPRGLLRARRVAFISESEESAAASLTMEEERLRFQQEGLKQHRASCVADEITLLRLRSMKRFGVQVGDSLLGQIHHEMAKYHEIGRFAPAEGQQDLEAALFHEQHAADLGIMEAIITMAKLYLDLPREVLINVDITQSEENVNKGVDYMMAAADAGDRSSMIYMAKAFDTGVGVGTERFKTNITENWEESVYWYENAIETTQSDDSGDFDATMDNPIYQMKARIAEMYLAGGPLLEKDPTKAAEMFNEAAEDAMSAMKGRLANKYYARAEEAYAEADE